MSLELHRDGHYQSGRMKAILAVLISIIVAISVFAIIQDGSEAASSDGVRSYEVLENGSLKVTETIDNDDGSTTVVVYVYERATDSGFYYEGNYYTVDDENYTSKTTYPEGKVIDLTRSYAVDGDGVTTVIVMRSTSNSDVVVETLARSAVFDSEGDQIYLKSDVWNYDYSHSVDGKPYDCTYHLLKEIDHGNLLYQLLEINYVSEEVPDYCSELVYTYDLEDGVLTVTADYFDTESGERETVVRYVPSEGDSGDIVYDGQNYSKNGDRRITSYYLSGNLRSNFFHETMTDLEGTRIVVDNSEYRNEDGSGSISIEATHYDTDGTYHTVDMQHYDYSDESSAAFITTVYFDASGEWLGTETERLYYLPGEILYTPKSYEETEVPVLVDGVEMNYLERVYKDGKTEHCIYSDSIKDVEYHIEYPDGSTPFGYKCTCTEYTEDGVACDVVTTEYDDGTVLTVTSKHYSSGTSEEGVCKDKDGKVLTTYTRKWTSSDSGTSTEDTVYSDGTVSKNTWDGDSCLSRETQFAGGESYSATKSETDGVETSTETVTGKDGNTIYSFVRTVCEDYRLISVTFGDFSLKYKVCDDGTYCLLDDEGNVTATAHYITAVDNSPSAYSEVTFRYMDFYDSHSNLVGKWVQQACSFEAAQVSLVYTAEAITVFSAEGVPLFALQFYKSFFDDRDAGVEREYDLFVYEDGELASHRTISIDMLMNFTDTTVVYSPVTPVSDTEYVIGGDSESALEVGSAAIDLLKEKASENPSVTATFTLSAGTVTLDSTAIANLNSGDTAVSIETLSGDELAQISDLVGGCYAAYTVDLGDNHDNFNGGILKIALAFSGQSENLAVLHVVDGAVVGTLPCTVSGGKVCFETGSLSTFVIVDGPESDGCSTTVLLLAFFVAAAVVTAVCCGMFAVKSRRE